MALRRFTKSVDGTIPVQALLYDDEEMLASQDGVGIYDGSQKAPDYQSGIIHVSSHRLFYIDHTNKLSRSFALDLSHVTQTEYYAGLFKSSSKVTLHLSMSSSPGDPNPEETEGFESWECEVCAYRNPPGLSPSAARICGLCGVPRKVVPAPPRTTLPVSSHDPNLSLSSSLPSSASTPTLPRHNKKPSSVACPACTFLNHPSMRECEICGTELPKDPATSQKQMKSAPATRPTSPGLDEEESGVRFIKLSFRKGGDKALYAVLKRSLQSKSWETNGVTSTSTPSENASIDGRRSGITGILRTVETSAQGRESNMKDALQDLEALMVKAKDMVRLAADLNERLTASSTSTSSNTASTTTLVPPTATEPEEATFIRSSLSQLGLQMANTPVTLDMMTDERKWIEELARELAGILQGSGYGKTVPSSTRDSGGGMGMMKQRGIIALDEVWGGWNRARGVALIPPSTFLQVLPQLQNYTNPTVSVRTLRSGLSVLHTPSYSHVAFTARICGLLTLAGPKTTTEVAQEESMTIGLTTEMLAAVEADGDVCRDDGSAVIKEGLGDIVVLGEVKWWANLFIGYRWDGQE